MAKKENLSEKFKEGVSVEEIEKFARKYTNEVFLILSIIIATISSIFNFFTGPSWSLFVAGLLTITGIAFPVHVGKIVKKIFKFQSTSEKTTIIIMGIVRLVLAIFIPFILFAEIGLLAGYSFHTIVKEFSFTKEMPKEIEKPSHEEHL
ncbi:MAG: hypothetical protein WCT85_06405 [Parachlamydiales bacterium]|jgi:O-antigen/teichoic acid export membrane protein